jgi:hypothetical protein
MPMFKISYGSTSFDASKALSTDGPILKIKIRDLKDETPGREVRAIIDTGSNVSCIDTKVAAELGLVNVGTIIASGASGGTKQPIFRAKLIVDDLSLVGTGSLLGVTLHDNLGAILGRDFLQGLKMIYDGQAGELTLVLDLDRSQP